MKQRESESWIVPPDLADRTLGAVLRQFCTGSSWSQIRRLINSRRVAVNQLLCLDDARRLRADDHLSLFSAPLPPPPDDGDVTVRHFDEDVIVVEKPAGMVSLRHVRELTRPAAWRRRQTSLDEVLLRLITRRGAHERDLSSLPPKLRRQYLRSVHRIDRDTSGLLVFARTAVAEQDLIEQFASHTIQRKYLAIVSGLPVAGELKSRLVRNRGDGQRGSTPSATDGKEAVTHIQEVEQLGDHSLVRCQLETGRTHQIRIHLSEAGFPVCGDTLYRGAFGADVVEDHSGSHRLALHACELAFRHPETGESMAFAAALPPDLERLVENLRQSETR